MTNNVKTFLIVAAVLGFAGIVKFTGFDKPQDSSKSSEDDAERRRISQLCAEAAKEEAQVMRFVYKIDGGYMVYVEPAWYGLKIDEKQAVAAYIARCKLGGSGRFLDSRTGKLLARWGSNGYVNLQD